MDWYNIIAQTFGIFGMTINVLSFQARKNSKMFFCQIFGTTFFVLNYLMLNSIPAALLNAVALVRVLLLIGGDRFNTKGWLIFVLLLNIGVVGFTYNGYLSIMILIAQIAQTIAMWSNNGKWIRYAQLFCASPLWLTHNVIVNSIGGVLCEVFAICSAIISMIRYGINGFEKK